MNPASFQESERPRPFRILGRCTGSLDASTGARALLHDSGSFVVETNTLLETAGEQDDKRRVKVLMTVELRPYFATPFNLSFVR